MSNYGHAPRKRFGQNFLHDQSVIQNILGHLQITSGEHWVEIGPGQGALTAPLAEQAERLDLVELDRDLVQLLKQQFAGRPQLAIHSADALQFDFSSLLENGEKLRIVGNLPYNISTPLLFHLFAFSGQIADMHFMLQKEVVDRMCAAPGSKKYGRLSVMLQYHCAAECLFLVPPESFDPQPKVMSAVVRLVPHAVKPFVIADKTQFDRIVTQAFSQRRKTLRNSLKDLVSEEAMQRAGVDPVARAETLSLAQFAALSQQPE